MFLMEYLYTKRKGLPDYSKKVTCNILHAYIHAHIQIIIDEYPGDGAKAISRLQSQCVNMKFDDKRIYKRLFNKLIHTGG